MTLKKYFLAIVVPSPHFEKIEAIKEELFLQHQLKGALRSPAHITLHRPFEWKAEKENVLIEKLKNFEWEERFEIVLNGFSCFEPRVMYVDVTREEKLDILQKKLTTFAKRELKLFNEAEDERGFHPHVTIAFRDLKKPKFYELWPEFEKKKFEGNFSFKGFSLLRLEDKWKEICFFDNCKS